MIALVLCVLYLVMLGFSVRLGNHHELTADVNTISKQTNMGCCSQCGGIANKACTKGAASKSNCALNEGDCYDDDAKKYGVNCQTFADNPIISTNPCPKFSCCQSNTANSCHSWC